MIIHYRDGRKIALPWEIKLPTIKTALKLGRRGWPSMNGGLWTSSSQIYK